MKAKVYFVLLTDDQHRAINDQGWSSAAGEAYLHARHQGRYGQAVLNGMIQEVASVEADDAEDIWVALQNGVPTRSKATVENKRPRIRSMDVGDLVAWADGRVERVASFGFEPVTEAVV